MPPAKVLTRHALSRIEDEFAWHLYLDHGANVGKWCDECKCVCVRAVETMVQRAWDMVPAWSQGGNDSPGDDGDDDVFDWEHDMDFTVEDRDELDCMTTAADAAHEGA